MYSILVLKKMKTKIDICNIMPVTSSLKNDCCTIRIEIWSKKTKTNFKIRLIKTISSIKCFRAQTIV